MNTPSAHSSFWRLGACQNAPGVPSFLVRGKVLSRLRICVAPLLYRLSFGYSRASAISTVPERIESRLLKLLLRWPLESTNRSAQDFMYVRYFLSPVRL